MSYYAIATSFEGSFIMARTRQAGIAEGKANMQKEEESGLPPTTPKSVHRFLPTGRVSSPMC